jgi:hypothetical protein
VERPEDVLSDEDCVRVHGSANFGARSPRWVVNDGVLKCSMGYHCGYTQLQILHEHKLVMKPRNYRPSLTKFGKRYMRALCGSDVIDYILDTKTP